jgi:DNA processing protein
VAILGEEAGDKVAHERTQTDPEREVTLAQRHGARILTWEEEGYPQALKEIPDPPPVLYMLGEWRPEDAEGVAIVGTRRCTSYGRLVAQRLAAEFAGLGITVISGLAPGIDTAAHKGALTAGRTIAVLGSGLGHPYPAMNAPLITGIARAGAVMSEFPWEMPGAQWTFPRRNRLIAGLALGVVVVEAPERSGALITADRALEQGKEVFAVPGPITSEASAGTNRLIQEGAKLVTTAADVLEELPMLKPVFAKAKEKRPDLGGDAKVVYELLSSEPLDLSELGERTGLPHARLAQVLVELELSGWIQEVAGRHYIRAR